MDLFCIVYLPWNVVLVEVFNMIETFITFVELALIGCVNRFAIFLFVCGCVCYYYGRVCGLMF